MAENHVSERVIGVAFDGTGYGTDGKIWGGEFLFCDYAGFERFAHFRYVPLAGGDATVREPWRMALAHLRDAFGHSVPELPMFNRVPENKIKAVNQILERRINCVDTSSCGRLFDAVSAIAGVRLATNYEGQAAIELEMHAESGVEEWYPFEIEAGEIDTRPLIRAVVADVLRGINVSAKFHNTIATIVLEVALQMRSIEKMNRVCLSGGTYQNVYLLSRSVALLRRAGFEVLLHSAVPANDGGLALGQAVIASQQLMKL
jgi:hydrogenase maturation protein HypF